jgi:MFS family permease
MKVWGVDQAAIGALYSLYSLAAIVTLLFGGILIDRFGTRTSSLAFSLLVTLGACVVAWAPNIQIAYLGRFLFGAGSESLITAQNVMLARWFKGKELALAFGVTLAISRIGTLFSFNTEALIATRYGPSMALWAAALFCGASLLANFVYIALDRHGGRILKLGDGSAGDRIVFADIASQRRFGTSPFFASSSTPPSSHSPRFRRISLHRNGGCPTPRVKDWGFSKPYSSTSYICFPRPQGHHPS